MRRAVLPRSSGLVLGLSAALAFALAGCSDHLPPPPVVTSVAPSSGLVDQSQTLQVMGTGFEVRVFANFSDPSQNRTDDTYQVTVGGVALTGVQHISTTQLNGTLPTGVGQGDNDVQVTDPWGRTATLAAGYFGIPPGGLPAQLAVLGPANVPIGACQAVTVEQRNSSAVATVSLTDTPVTLDTNPASAFGIFADSGCSTATTTATIISGQTQAVVYVLATDRVSASLSASSTGLTTGTLALVFGPTRLGFASSAITANVGVCVGTPVTVETRNPAGAASAVASDTAITLSAPGNLALFSDSGCASATTSITVPAGQTTASFFIKGLASGSFTVTASSSGYTNATQQETIQANTIFVLSSVAPAQGVSTPFPLTIEAQDGLGNLVTTYTGTAVLSGVGGPSVSCAFNCSNGTTTTNFVLGGWSGWVTVNAAASSAMIHAASGSIAGDSNSFGVLAADAGFPPTARLMVRPGAVKATSDQVTLDARLSSDYGQGALEYSFDPYGTATTDAGTTPWTNWQTSATYNATGYGTGVYTPRVAVRKTGDTVISYGAATVAGAGTVLCTVTTTSMVNDGATSCSQTTKFGSDNAISLPEAVSLTNGAANRVITTNFPLRLVSDPAHAVPAVTNGTWISFASGTQLVGIPLSLSGAGALVANADISGAATWTVGADATIQDSVLRERAALTSTAALTLNRLWAFNCAPGGACALASGATGAITALFSQFNDVPGDALRAAPTTSGGPCPATALTVRSSTFTRAGTGVHDDCTTAASIVHSTFHANTTGVSYSGGSGHTLLNSVFTANGTATSCGTAAFTARDYNVLSGNTADGCVGGGDANTVSGDPLYFLPETGDLRLRPGSPARDSAADLGLDVNDVGPNNFFGSAPDRGGRETP